MQDERVWRERGLRDGVLNGDEDAWRALYDRWFAPLYAHVLPRCAGNRHKAEEVVQEAWMVAVRRIADFDPERAGFGTWLFGIANGVLRNKWRRWQRRDETETPWNDADKAIDASAQLETSEHVALTLAELPPQYRELLQAKYGVGESVAEIAENSGKTPKAVESLLSRARDAFRKRFKELDGGNEHE
jgi:RNA polymerase sigma-70 factor, ECF subfamily